MHTWIEQNGPDYRVNFSQGVQGFTLDCLGTKEEAEWMKSRLDEAFKIFKEECASEAIKNHTTKTIVNSSKIKELKAAIYSAVGISFEQYTTDKRKVRDCFFARLIFIHYCSEVLKMSYGEIKLLVKRKYTTVRRCAIMFDDEVKYNKEFRDLVAKFESNLSKHVSV